MDPVPRNSLMGRLQQRGMLATSESPRLKEQSGATARAAAGSSESTSANCEKSPAHSRTRPRPRSSDKESPVGGCKSDQQARDAQPARKCQRAASSEKGGPVVTPKKGSSKTQQPVGSGMSPGSSERGKQGSLQTVQQSKREQPATGDGQLQRTDSSSGGGVAGGGDKMKQHEASGSVPKDPKSRPSIGQWLWASAGALLRMPSSPCATPSKRKVGKQRPSILPPECLPRPVRKSIATYKPRRRKMGKQRPSVLFPLGNILKENPDLPSQEKLVGRTGLLANTLSNLEKIGATLLKGSSTKSSSSDIQKVTRTPQGKLVAQTGLLANASCGDERIGVEALKDNSGCSDGQDRPGPEKLADQTGSLAKHERIGAEPLKGSSGSSDIQDVKRTSSNLKTPILKRVSLKTAKREEDNYELSDLEEDSHGHRIEPDRTAKRVPAWCSSWSELAMAQAEINPDSIFGSQVPKCDLDVIFPDHFYAGRKPVKRRRGSSCNWLKDALTKREIIAYATKMGQNKRWSSIPQKSLRASGRRKAAGPKVLSCGKEAANAAQVSKEIVQALIAPVQAPSDKQ